MISIAKSANLVKYIELLLEFQQHTNLIGKSTVSNIWTRHVEDSFQLMKYINEVPNATTVVDIGSGAGFPGMVLAIEDPSRKYILIDSNSKKANFLNQIVRELGLKNVEVINDRVENLNKSELNVDVIVSRAVCNLKLLLDISYVISQSGVTCLFLKGENFQKEIQEANSSYKTLKYALYPSETNEKSRIISVVL